MGKQIRLALCLYGNFNNRLSQSSGLDGFEYIRANLLDKYEFDVFLDSTDSANFETITSLYGPWLRDANLGPSRTYDKTLEQLGIQESAFVLRDGFRKLSNTLSFLDSRAQSINLMSNYAEQFGNYDVVVTCRFDLGQIDKYNGKHSHKVSEIGFNPDLDMTRIYSAQWSQHDAGYADQWFYSSQSNIELLGKMADECPNYFQVGSGYLQWLEAGITDSDTTDEFANVRLREPLANRPAMVKRSWRSAVDNHMLHKFYFIQTGLYSKSEFTSDLHGIALAVYSHTDYKDVWPAFFGELEKYLGLGSKIYLLIDKNVQGIPEYISQVIYNDTLPYSSRLVQALSSIHETHVLFLHEDMILSGLPEVSSIVNFVENHMKSGHEVEYLRLIRAFGYFGVPQIGCPGFSHIIKPFSRWIFSIQPSIWRREALVSLAESANGLGIWDFEVFGQKAIKRMGIKSATLNQKSVRRGKHHWDSKIFPYIATAIVKGKWNTTEYGPELNRVFKAYEIDPSVRGTI